MFFHGIKKSALTCRLLWTDSTLALLLGNAEPRNQIGRRELPGGRAHRPIDARLNLPEGKASYLLQEFSQLFCVEKAFAVGARQFETVFRQKLSVDVLEDINRALGAQADSFLENVPVPPPADPRSCIAITPFTACPTARFRSMAMRYFATGSARYCRTVSRSRSTIWRPSIFFTSIHSTSITTTYSRARSIT